MFHRLLAQGLSDFLNASYQTRAGRVLYPLLDRQDLELWRQWVDELQELSVGLGQSNRPPAPCTDSLDTFAVANYLSRVFAWTYDNYPSNQAERVIQKIHCLQSFDFSVYEKHGEVTLPVIELTEYAQGNIADAVTGFYIHGSFSTLDYVPGSSDLDTVLVVAKETLLSPERLIDLRKHLLHMLRWFYQIDYSQHHGYFVLSELDLAYFDDAFFPSVLFPISTVILGADELSVRRRRTQSDPTLPFRRMCDRIRDVANGKANLEGWFELKLHLQGILLLPTLYLQARHHPVYKRDSFALVHSHVSSEAWKIIGSISKIRSLGVQEPLFSSRWNQPIAKLPSPWAASIIHRWLRNGVPRIVWEHLGDNWQQQSLTLADTFSNRLRRDEFLS